MWDQTQNNDIGAIVISFITSKAWEEKQNKCLKFLTFESRMNISTLSFLFNQWGSDIICSKIICLEDIWIYKKVLTESKNRNML